MCFRIASFNKTSVRSSNPFFCSSVRVAHLDKRAFSKVSTIEVLLSNGQELLDKESLPSVNRGSIWFSGARPTSGKLRRTGREGKTGAAQAAGLLTQAKDENTASVRFLAHPALVHCTGHGPSTVC